MVRVHSGAVLVLLLCLAGCGAPELTRIEGATMGTYYRVSMLCRAEHQLSLKQFNELLRAVNASMSNYLPDSELSRLNRHPVAEWFAISEPLYRVLSAAVRIHERSGGAIDPTISPVLRLWGFGPGATVPERAPDAKEVAAAKAQTGLQHLALRARPRSARRMRQIELDLSAIAKGYGVDVLAEALSDAGCDRYLVDIGGEVRGAGQGPAGAGWRVGVELPDATRFGEIARILSLRDLGLATSGDYRNFIDSQSAQGRQRWSHTIDPRTATPVDHALASVTVAAPSTLDADGWATALTVLGPEAALTLAQAEGLAALFLVRTDGGFEARYTEALKPLLVPQ